MTRDDKMIYEGFSVYNRMAGARQHTKIAGDALKECLKHFESEPTDKGHPELIILVKKTLKDIGMSDTTPSSSSEGI